MHKQPRQNSPLSLLLAILVTSLTLLASSVSFSATVVKVKGKNILIKLSGEDYSKGDVLITTTKKGKKKGLVRITRVKGEKAIGKLIKGKAKKGWKLRSRKKAVAKKSPSKRKRAKASKYTIGILAGQNMNSMDIKLNAGTTTVNTTGSGTSIKLLMDLNIWESIGIRATIGTDAFEAKEADGGTSCSSEQCTTSISYLSLHVLARYIFGGDSMKFWLGAGMGLLNPNSPTSNAIDTTTIKMTSSITAAGGVDFSLGESYYIPVQVSYNLLPNSDTATAAFIAANVGFGYRF